MPERSATRGDSIAQVQQNIRDLLWEANGLVILAKAYGRGLEPTGVISAQQQVLRVLASGPRTVPELARERSTSRQNIQIVVNRLAEMNLVEAVDNPHHRRSKLIGLLPAGRAALEQLTNSSPAAALPFDLSKLQPETLSQALKTLREVREIWLCASSAPKPGHSDNALSVKESGAEIEPAQPVPLGPQPLEALPVSLL